MISSDDTFLCPVKSIKRYLRERAKHNLELGHKPFFMTKDTLGKNLTIINGKIRSEVEGLMWPLYALCPALS